jgi:hypothetical protein
VSGVSSFFGAQQASQAQLQAAQQAQAAIQAGIQQGTSAIQNFTTQGASSLKDLLSQGINLQSSYVMPGVAAEAPYAGAGADILPTLKALLTPGKSMTDVLSQIPGFQFAQDWGTRAIQNLATTRGLGGNVLTAGAQYSTGLAQQGWQSIVNSLQALLGTGAGAAGNILSMLTGAGGQALGGAVQTGGGLGQLFGQAGSSIADLISGGQKSIATSLTGAGSAAAAGITGMAGAAGNLGTNISNLGMLNALTGGKIFQGMFSSGSGS